MIYNRKKLISKRYLISKQKIFLSIFFRIYIFCDFAMSMTLFSRDLLRTKIYVYSTHSISFTCSSNLSTLRHKNIHQSLYDFCSAFSTGHCEDENSQCTQYSQSICSKYSFIRATCRKTCNTCSKLWYNFVSLSFILTCYMYRLNLQCGKNRESLISFRIHMWRRTISKE